MVIMAIVLSGCVMFNFVKLGLLLNDTSMEVFSKNPPAYKDSNAFFNQIENAAHDINNMMDTEETLLVDGKLDEKRLVDVIAYDTSHTITDKNESGIAYSIETLLKIHETDYDYHTLFVCEKMDGTYDYYTTEEFTSLIKNKELCVKDLSTEDVLSWVASDPLEYFENVLDKDNNVLYTSVRGEEYFLSKAAYEIDGKNIVDIVNENKDLNGKFMYVIDTIQNVASDIYDKVDAYKRNDTEWNDEKSNLTWMYVNTDTGLIRSNKTAYNNKKDFDAFYKEIQENKEYAYVYIRPDNLRYETNSKKEYGNMNITTNKQRALLLAVDTTYPVSDSFSSSYNTYNESIGNARKTLIYTVIMSILFVLDLIMITYVCGKREEDEEIYLTSFDHWKTEIGACSVIGVWVCLMVIIADCGFYYSNENAPILYSIFTMMTCMFFLFGYTSLVRRIKAHTMWTNSLLYMFIQWFINMWNHRSIIGRLVIEIIGLIFINLLSYASGFFFLACIIDGIAIYFVLKKTIDQSKIRDGLKQMGQGNMSYEIPTDKMGKDDKELVEAINNIQGGMKVAIDQSLKSERMKTELIANVSHDIKTPLTSIINYVDLLKREHIDNEKVQEYIKVLEEKSQRLKTLTEDVVEASKVSSGNIQLECMDLNLNEILNQTIGEFEELFEEKQLQLISSIPIPPTIVSVDGRRVFRILENIFNNALKYSMPNTRVYVELKEENGSAIIIMKNVSEQPLNISAEELTERFIRGDASRTTEGSGIGLSIAKSLTELQHGTFEIQLDGDLFKVFIQFPIKRGILE